MSREKNKRDLSPTISGSSDVMSPEQRSRCMSRIRNKNTPPEIIVRRLVHSSGYRFVLHKRGLPGTPDLVFPRYRKIIFVHGCFWHRHACRNGRRLPKSRVDFWTYKLAGNKARDLATRRRLRRLGWRFLVIWECEITDSEALTQRIAAFLGKKL